MKKSKEKGKGGEINKSPNIKTRAVFETTGTFRLDQ
jgi:hypothetical protein